MIPMVIASLISVASRQSPVASCQLPVTSYQLPVTSYQLPVTSYQLPVTSCQLPVHGFDRQLFSMLADYAERQFGIVFERDQVLVPDGFFDEAALEFERLHRIEIVRHDPRHVYVRDGRDQIRGEHRRPAARVEVDDLVETGVAASA